MRPTSFGKLTREQEALEIETANQTILDALELLRQHPDVLATLASEYGVAFSGDHAVVARGILDAAVAVAR